MADTDTTSNLSSGEPDFASFLSSRIDAEIAKDTEPTPEPAPEPAPEQTPEKKDETKVVVPPQVTDALLGKKEEPKTEAEIKALDEAAEKTLDDLFATKQGEAFKQTKAQIKERDALIASINAERESLRQQLEAAKTAVPKSEEIDAAKADAVRAREEAAQVKAIKDQYEKELSVVKVEATEEFQRAVAQPLKEVKATVARIAAANDVPEATILAALAETDAAKQDQLLNDLGLSIRERDRHTIYKLVDDYSQLVSRERSVKENAAAALKVIEDNRQAQIAALQQSEATAYKTGLDAAWGELQAKVPLFKKLEGADDWNQNVEQMEQFARTLDWNQLDHTQRAQLVFQGASMPLVLGVTEFYANQIQQLQAEIAEMRKGVPGAGAGTGAQRPAVASTEGMGFLESVNQRARELGLQ